MNRNIPSVQKLHGGFLQLGRATGNVGFMVLCTCGPFQQDVPAAVLGVHFQVYDKRTSHLVKPTKAGAASECNVASVTAGAGGNSAMRSLSFAWRSCSKFMNISYAGGYEKVRKFFLFHERMSSGIKRSGTTSG